MSPYAACGKLLTVTAQDKCILQVSARLRPYHAPLSDKLWLAIALLGLAAVVAVLAWAYRAGQAGPDPEYAWRADAKAMGLNWRALDAAGMTPERFARVTVTARRAGLQLDTGGLAHALAMARLGSDGTGCGALHGAW